MRRHLCLFGLLVIVGCNVPQSSSTSDPPTTAAKDEAVGPSYTLSVPNMT